MEMKMNILVIGSGGREHALVYKLSQSPSADKIYCTPGNPGIFNLAENPNINSGNFEEISSFCKSNDIGLVVVGPEQPLSEGITDYLRAQGINVFGPTKAAAMLESSKGFAKDFMLKYNIPTAAYKRFIADEKESALNYINEGKFPVVIKADGLAAGKGVIIAMDSEEAHNAIDEIFGGVFGSAGSSIVIEEFLPGEEASILAITDGNDFVALASSQDHKRIFDGDKGKNTGGMGAYAPASIVTEELLEKVNDRILKPAIEGMKQEGTPFTGCLYAGLMISEGNPYVVEFNVRFGDPETQSVLTVFDGDFAKLLYSSAIGVLDKSSITNTSKGFSCCVIISSDGYPDNYEKGNEITGIEEADKSGAIVFHAGTSIKENKLVNTGGRVLGVCGSGSTLKESIDNAYIGLKNISFKNMFYRKDIGKKGLK
jgi:phosphoribosylamine---glycine ligase